MAEMNEISMLVLFLETILETIKQSDVKVVPHPEVYYNADVEEIAEPGDLYKRYEPTGKVDISIKFSYIRPKEEGVHLPKDILITAKVINRE